MIVVETLICATNGEQMVGATEFPDDFFAPQPPQPTETEKLRADVDFLAMETGVTL